MSKQLTDVVVDTSIKYRWILFLLSIVFIVVNILGIPNFAFDASPRAYFDSEYSHYADFKAIEDKYGRDTRIMIMLEATKDDIFTRNNLALIEELTRQSWQLPNSIRVDSLANYQHSHSEGDDLYVDSLIEEAQTLSHEQIQQIKDIATNEPSLINRLITPNSKYAAVIVTFSITEKDQQIKEAELGDQVYAVIDTLEKANPDINFYISGDIISNYNNALIAIHDISIMIPLMFIIMFVMLGLLMKTISGVLVAFFIAMTTTLATIGLATWVGIVFSMLSMNTVMITITVTLAHCIHILSYFFHAYRKTDKRSALTESLRVNLLPVTITSLTTALGFLTLNFGDMPPVADLGNVSAIGVCISWLFSLTILPALVLLLPFKIPKGESGFIELQMIKLSERIIQHKKLLLTVTLIFSAIMVTLSLTNIINDRFSEMIKKPHKFRMHNEAIDSYFGGLYNGNYDVYAKSAGGITDTEYLHHLDKFTQWLRTQPDISSVNSISDTIKRLNKNMHGDDPAYYRIPKDTEMAAQLLLLYEISLPYGLDLNNQIATDKGSSRVMITYPSKDTHAIFELQDRVSQWQKTNLPDYMISPGASMAIMWSHLSEDSLLSSMQGSFIALLVISIVMIMVLKSLRYGLISLIPNILPATIGLGIWAVISGELGMGLTSVIIITIGIVVDDTVHFLSKYKYARQTFSASPEDGVRYAFRHVGTALWTTTLVLVSGFSLLMLSKITNNSDMGFLTALILIAALTLDFLLLPPLLLLLDQRKPVK